MSQSSRSLSLLVESIEHLEPGRSIVFRRVMDEREDLYADDHTLGGRGVSRVDPGQNGLPVLPMTFSLEAMAEAAMVLAPGKVVVAIRNVRLYRWLPFDPEPTTLEVRASLVSTDARRASLKSRPMSAIWATRSWPTARTSRHRSDRCARGPLC